MLVFAIPGYIFVGLNSITLWAQALLPASTYQVLSTLKIVFTGIFFGCLLKRKLTLVAALVYGELHLAEQRDVPRASADWLVERFTGPFDVDRRQCAPSFLVSSAFRLALLIPLCHDLSVRPRGQGACHAGRGAAAAAEA